MGVDAAPRFPPAGACDCHVHVIGPKAQFPLARERTYTPMDAPAAELRAMLARLGLDRVVIVQPSIYGADNACILDALAQLGNARGVAVLPARVAGSVLDDLHRRGIRGLRVNMGSGGAMSGEVIRDSVEAAAALCSRNGWHFQVFAPAAVWAPVTQFLLALPVPVVMDHFGMVPLGVDGDAAVRWLMQLLESGRGWVKISAAYRIAGDPADERIGVLARRLVMTNPERIVWGSDWPHTPVHGHRQVADDREQPYQDIDTLGLLDLVARWLPEPRLREQVLVANPARLYGF